jgi:CRISPR-associated endonuclease/helicase Cas3
VAIEWDATGAGVALPNLAIPVHISVYSSAITTHMIVIGQQPSVRFQTDLRRGQDFVGPRCFYALVADYEVLSEAARQVWGKSARILPYWLPLWRHLADSADIAGRLWDFWLPDAVRSHISRELPGGEDDGRRLVRWLAGIHDIGKATPAFASQVRQLADRMQDHGFTFNATVRVDRRLVPHSTAGHLVLSGWLGRQYGWAPWQAAPFAVIVGGHHGVPPTDQDLDTANRKPLLVGLDNPWVQVRDELLNWMAERVGASSRFAEWREVPLSQPVQAALTGVVIVADWIASNEDLFPYAPHLLNADDRADRGWQELDLPSPWRAVKTDDTASTFASRFALPSGAQLRPVQQAVAEAAARMPAPGLLIVEAPMGEGKTEAALLAVETLAARTGAGGCYIALPTRATSDAMFSRVIDWLRRLPDRETARGAYGVALAHGKSGLNSEFTLLYRRSLPSAIGVDEGGADIAAHRWMAGRKRSLLSSFAIGTIDQLLFAALKARHLALRHLGLAGKVVVIDEAHAYDVYMSTYLDRALEWLGAHGVPVVVLSATLPASRRAEMMEAYDLGRLGPVAPPRFRWSTPPSARNNPYQELRSDQRYPLITTAGVDRNPRSETCPASGRGVSIRLDRRADDPQLLAETLRGELRDGGCALVICNTVRRVQETAQVLRSRLGPAVPVSVAHSRFIALDRAVKDRWLRDTFGPQAHLESVHKERPPCHVVVASQVAEQSLDIDFDLLVTDLAPVDLLLQRVGRLHRHADRDRPPRLAEARCLVVGADWEADPPQPVAGSRRVYEEAALLRSAAVLWPHLQSDLPVRLPNDIAPLVQAAYGDGQVGPPSWQSDIAEAAADADRRRHAKRERAKTFRLGPVREVGDPIIAWLDAGTGDTEALGDDARGRAHVRDDGAEALDVLLLVRRGGDLITPPWLRQNGGLVVPTDFAPPRDLAKTIAACTLSLPAAVTARGVDEIIAEVEGRNNLPAWQDDPWLGGELVLDVDDAGQAVLGGFLLEYDPHDGLKVSPGTR